MARPETQDRAYAERPHLLGRLVRIEAGEGRAVAWAFSYFFFLLSSYYVIRPLRDALGLAGEDRLTWLYMGTLVGTIAANPVLGALVSRYSRRVFIPLVYHVLAANLVLFYILLSSTGGDRQLAVGRVFFVWASVFNLFAVSVFWGFMADLFRSEQGKRLFGFIGLGGTLGAIAGASVTAGLAELVGPTQLLLVAAMLLEAAVLCVGRLARTRIPMGATDPSMANGVLALEDPPLAAAFPPGAASPEGAGRHGRGADDANDSRARAHIANRVPPRGDPDAPPGHGLWNGIRLVVRSPYLLGICLFLLLYSLSSTLIYFEQARIVRAAIPDHAQRTALFARIDLFTNLLTAFTQCFLTGRILRRLGVGLTLAALPTITFLGFGALALSPYASTLAVIQVVRRGAEYALVRPAREVLFTVVSREQKYTSKNLIDTFVYRGGDALGALLDRGLGAISLTAAQIPLFFLPLAAVWVILASWLGRKQTEAAVGMQRG